MNPSIFWECRKNLLYLLVSELIMYGRGHYTFLKCSPAIRPAWKLSNARRILVIRCVEMNLRPLKWPVSDFPKTFGQNGWKLVQKSAKMGFFLVMDFTSRTCRICSKASITTRYVPKTFSKMRAFERYQYHVSWWSRHKNFRIARKFGEKNRLNRLLILISLTIL